MDSWATRYDYIVWALTAIAEVAVLMRLRYCRAIKRQCGISALLILHLCVDPIMLAVGKFASPETFVRAFTAYLLIDYFIQFCLIWQVFCSVKRFDLTTVPGKMVVVLIVGTLAFSIYVGAGHSTASTTEDYKFLIHSDATLSYARCCLLSEVILFSWIIQSPWSRGELYRSVGMAIYAAAQLAFVQTQAAVNFAGHEVARVLPGIVYLATLALWYSVESEPPAQALPTALLVAMKQRLLAISNTPFPFSSPEDTKKS